MAYIDPAAFRKGTQEWYTLGLELTRDEASDDLLTAAIQAQSGAFDLYTDDHFSPEPGDGPPETTTTIDMQGSGGPNLYVPKRIRSVTDVSLRDLNGDLTSQDASIYRVTASLVNGQRQEADLDMITIVSGQFLNLGGGTGWWNDWTWNTWPTGVGTVQVTGTFCWPETPEQVKRAVAIMVYDSIKPSAPGIRTASRYISGSTSFEMPTPTADSPTGLHEVDRIIGQYTRERIPAI